MSETRNRDGLDGSSNERSFAVPTLVVAIIGAVTGIVGLALGVFGCWEERKIDLTVRATVDGYAGADPMQVRVAIANGGVRGVVIESASVERDRRQLGETLGY